MGGGYMQIDLQTQLIKYITENQESFYRLAYSHISNRESALDIVQNAIVRALENYLSIRNPEYMKTWFYRVLINECYAYKKKNNKEISYDPEILEKLQEEEQEEQTRLDIYHQVQKLPDKMKTVIILRFYEELSLKEIAEVTRSGVSAVKYRLYAGLKRMEQNMKEESK